MRNAAQKQYLSQMLWKRQSVLQVAGDLRQRLFGNGLRSLAASSASPDQTGACEPCPPCSWRAGQRRDGWDARKCTRRRYDKPRNLLGSVRSRVHRNSDAHRSSFPSQGKKLRSQSHRILTPTKANSRVFCELSSRIAEQQAFLVEQGAQRLHRTWNKSDPGRFGPRRLAPGSAARNRHTGTSPVVACVRVYCEKCAFGKGSS